MKIVALIIWLLGPTSEGVIVEVGPVVVASYGGQTAEANCTAMLNRMIRASDGKVRGRCDIWN